MTSEIVKHLTLSLVVIILAIILRFVLGAVIKTVPRKLMADPVVSQDPQPVALTKRFVVKASGLDGERHSQRVGAFGSLLRNVIDVVLVFSVVLTILALWGVPMTPFLASAGVGGIAIGFGAQSLVKDYISGIFMLTEDQFGLNDFVEIGDLKGTVVQVTLRITKIRDEAGTLWYLRNGEILKVGNWSQGDESGYVDLQVALDEDPARVVPAIQKAVAGMGSEPQWRDALVEEPEVLGIEAAGEESMTIRVRAVTRTGQRSAALREIRLRALSACEEAGVKLLPAGVDDA